MIATTPEGYTKADVEAIADLKLKGGALASIASSQSFQSRFAYHEGKRPWTLLPKIHIALPSATQNEISGEEAEALVKAGVKIVAEGSNMVSCMRIYYANHDDNRFTLLKGSTLEAVEVFEKSRKEGGIWYAPGSTSTQPHLPFSH